MPRSYRKRSTRSEADRVIQVRYERRDEVDVARIAEVVIRVTLNAANESNDTGEAGAHLRDLLKPKQ